VANIKRLEQLSGWIEYALETTLLDPPVLKLRLRPLDALSMVTNEPAGVSFAFGRFAADNAAEAVAEWDLCVDGVPVPVTPENKMLYLRPILAEVVEGRGLLGLAILEDAQDRKIFIKN
jgi:hypothetical protein